MTSWTENLANITTSQPIQNWILYMSTNSQNCKLPRNNSENNSPLHCFQSPCWSSVSCLRLPWCLVSVFSSILFSGLLHFCLLLLINVLYVFILVFLVIFLLFNKSLFLPFIWLRLRILSFTRYSFLFWLAHQIVEGQECLKLVLLRL